MPGDPCGPERFVGVSSAIGRAVLSEDVLPCVTPSGRIFSVKRNRLVLGEEFMRCQGIFFDDEVHDEMGKFGSSVLADLAGNAFQTHTCAAVVVAALFVLANCFHAENAVPARFLHPAPVPARRRQLKLGGDDSSDSDGPDFVY